MIFGADFRWINRSCGATLVFFFSAFVHPGKMPLFQLVFALCLFLFTLSYTVNKAGGLGVHCGSVKLQSGAHVQGHCRWGKSPDTFRVPGALKAWFRGSPCSGTQFCILTFNCDRYEGLAISAISAVFSPASAKSQRELIAFEQIFPAGDLERLHMCFVSVTAQVHFLKVLHFHPPEENRDFKPTSQEQAVWNSSTFSRNIQLCEFSVTVGELLLMSLCHRITKYRLLE